MKILRLLALTSAAVALLAGLSAEAEARERRVPGEYPTIQAAIDAAADGDVVRVAPGVYGESIRWGGKNIRLIGAGAGETIVDPSAGPGGRCLSLDDVPAPAEVRGLACQNGVADIGGGIMIRGGSPALIDLRLERNAATAGRGGGVYVEQGSVTVEGCTFLDNEAREQGDEGSSPFGGGLYIGHDSHAAVSSTVFARNSARRGGGMTVANSHALVHDVTFEENTGGLHLGISGNADVSWSTFLRNRGFGGGLESQFLGDVNVSDSLFEGNTSEIRGGGMRVKQGNVTVTRCVFRDNTSVFGGGLALSESGTRVSDSWFIGNHATKGGGGLGLGTDSGTLIERSWVLDNDAAGSGGGVGVSGGSVWMEGTVIRGNRAGANGGGMAVSNGNAVSLEDCVIRDNTAGALGGGVSIDAFLRYSTMVACTLTGNTAGERGGGMAVRRAESDLAILNSIFWGNRSDQIWIGESDPSMTVTTSVTYSDVQGGFPGVGNIDADPLFVDAARGDLRLGPGSPARDAGVDTGELSAIDMAGNPRVVGPAPDMGAYEFTPAGEPGAPGRGR